MNKVYKLAALLGITAYSLGCAGALSASYTRETIGRIPCAPSGFVISDIEVHDAPIGQQILSGAPRVWTWTATCNATNRNYICTKMTGQTGLLFSSTGYNAVRNGTSVNPYEVSCQELDY